MSNARNLSSLLESDGDVKTSALDNVSAPTKSTIDALGIAATSVTGSQASAITANTAKITYPSADSTKLGGIETSATADQTNAEIKTAVEAATSIALGGSPTTTTQAESDDSTKVATTAYVTDKITTLIGGAPSTLNDLNELAAAINDDADYNSTLTTALATKLPLAGGAMTGAITTNSTFDGVDVAAAGTLANNAMPKAGGTMTGNITLGTNNVTFTNWTITESSGVLKFATGGTNKMKLDASGNLTVVGDITAFGTI